jgi:hypothetical protein
MSKRADPVMVMTQSAESCHTIGPAGLPVLSMRYDALDPRVLDPRTFNEFLPSSEPGTLVKSFTMSLDKFVLNLVQGL